jgi:hypothetical protein
MVVVLIILTGTSFGEHLSKAGYLSIFGNIGHRDLAAPTVSSLAAYLLSLDQYRGQLLV